MTAAAATTRLRRRWTPGTLVGVALLALLAVSTLYPIVFVAFTSFKTEEQYGTEPLAIPRPFTTEYVEQAWSSAQLGDALVNSLLVVIPAVAVIVVVSLLAGYALAHVPFRGRGVLFLIVIGLMTIPSAVLMVPIFRTVGQLGLLNDRLGLVLVYAALNAPFSIYLVSAYLRRLPVEVLEAAELDGAGELRILQTIVGPLSMPAINTLVVLNFLWLWNELLFALLILQDPSKRTTTVALASLEGNLSTPVPLLAAGLLISLAPVLLVYLTSQRRLVRGLTVGAVK